MADRKPTPGSAEARAIGCTCPVIDNHHGRGMPYPDGPRFWVSGNCSVHKSPERVTLRLIGREGGAHD